MEKVATVLKMIKTKAGAEAALLTTGDGVVLEGVSEADINLKAIAAYAARYIAVSEHLAEHTRSGHTQSVILFYQNKTLVITPLTDSVVAVVVGSERAHLGNLRLQLGRSLEDLLRALREDMPEMALSANGEQPAAAPARLQEPATVIPPPAPPEPSPGPDSAPQPDALLDAVDKVVSEEEVVPEELPPTFSESVVRAGRAGAALSDTRQFDKRIEKELARAQKHGAEFSVAVLALEGLEATSLIGRKGHKELIHLFTERLQRTLRVEDIAAELEDGTFGLLLVDVNRDQARAIVQRIIAQTLEDNLQRPRTEGTFRIRAGVAAFPEAGSTVERLMQRATTALFLARIEAAVRHAQEHPAEFSVAVIALSGFEDSKAKRQDAVRAQLVPLFVKRVQIALRAADMAVALDNGKIGVLLAGVNRDQGRAIVQRIIIQALKDNLGFPKSVTGQVRAGVATFPDAGTTAQRLLQQAEATLELISL